MKTTTETTVKTVTRITFSEEELIELIKQASGLTGDIDVHFDCSYGAHLNGCVVTSTYTKVNY
jgi:hypothetical protein